MRCWRFAPVAVLLAACTPTNTTNPPPFDAAQFPPIRLAVGTIDVSSAAKYPADMGFIARASVEEATLVEQPRPVDRGVVAAATQPNWEMAGVLALKVAIVDGLGIEQSYASSRVEIKRSISERASVEAKDDFARTIINDLIAASSTQLENSINQNLGDRKAP